ncbi:U3 small nucleolar RNA-associated protein-like protein [Hapsidospora chrysogenum ATCC 11550]|uniref:U3 small nucleolar RNA-associated protein 11 n=1 Tax=Hapsidospora chrysogenum (strain ATCC 11550 / CBS 779.69 / DSM 880 / IAM 14645 / JCM 23072 / IMI 49137) TaxID=857340 RepID=A0A086T4Y6_HAPC1|nr:U3 small nucleolar RNA-associated protein-like protein [Hapsidospora chrysogenum ATCC 11550]
MSSMRNAVQRRPHRERAQPLERGRLGLLEKHKDYSLRAKDYNKKQEVLKNLRQKAAERNEDEFYFGMMSRQGPGSRIINGKSWDGKVKGDRGNKTLDQDTVRLLKTQDRAYIRTMRQIARKEVAQLEEQVVLTRGLDRLDDDAGDDEDSEADDSDDEMLDLPAKPKPARKIVFLDNEEDREEALGQEEDENADGDAEFEGFADEGKAEEGDDRAQDLRRLRRQLKAARRKLQVLTEAEWELENQRVNMAKTATPGGVSKKGQKNKVRTRKR